MPNSPTGARVAAKPLFLCKPFVTSQLVKGSFSTIVVLPKYVDQGEWLALNGTWDFLKLRQGAIADKGQCLSSLICSIASMA